MAKLALIFFQTLLILLACVNMDIGVAREQRSSDNVSSSSRIEERRILGLTASKLVMAAEVRHMQENYMNRPSSTPFIRSDQPLDVAPLQTSELVNRLLEGSVIHGFFAGFRSAQYYMEMSVGTPPVLTTFIVDTGSSLTWLQCSENFNQGAPGALYNRTLSSSFSAIPCPSDICSSIPISRGCNADNQCTFKMRYFDGGAIKGVLGLDTFRFDGSALVNTGFGCADEAEVSSLAPGRGLLGFGAAPYALPRRLRSNIFFCLPTRTFDNGEPTTTPGVAGLGDLDLPHSTTFTRLIIDPLYHVMAPMEGISIDGSLLPLVEDDFDSNPGSSTMIDTGSPLSYLLPSTYVIVRDAFRRAARKRGLTEVGIDTTRYPVDTCYHLDPDHGPTHENTPSMEFHFEDEAILYLNPRNILFRIIPTSDLYCLTFAKKPTPVTPHLTVLGNIQLASTLVSINFHDNSVAFTPFKC